MECEHEHPTRNAINLSHRHSFTIPDTRGSDPLEEGAAGSESATNIESIESFVAQLIDDSAVARVILRRSIFANNIGGVKLCRAFRMDVLEEEHPWAADLIDDGYPEDEVLDPI
jgi:hypothetical protein